ncbi:MAG: bifunctional protein-serine/threonine kinase/phosphatase [Pseudomonadota bacterium]|nr:bifunctional protein-serine/threonine kinase/phosphatase [Pseudomonadota bacterium]
MASELAITIGQYSDKGAKAENQDFHGAIIPDGPALALKGIAIAIADGISSSAFGRVAAESAVRSFLTDYYATSDAWTVKTAASRVIAATNSWLHGETRRASIASGAAGDLDRGPDRGHVTTFSALVLKARKAHLFHVGDARISRLVGESLETLTEDHRLVLSAERSYLARALGMGAHVEIDYRALDLVEGDVFLMTTDGVHEVLAPTDLARALRRGHNDLPGAARTIAADALAVGSRDNITIQIVRVDRLPEIDAAENLAEADLEPPSIMPSVGDRLDGWHLEELLHASARSHVFRAREAVSGERCALKILASDLRDDATARRRFLMEEWIAARVSNPHLLKAHPRKRPRSALYTTMALVKGRTLKDWMRDHPAPDLQSVQDIVIGIGKGLLALHRRQIVHQDLRPENVLLDADGHVTLIDFGAARVAGVEEGRAVAMAEAPVGTLQYAAPEAFLGEVGRERSDLFSLGVLTYEMLTGRLPYGLDVARTRTRRDQRRLAYRPAGSEDRHVPDWIEGALKKAVAIDPEKRHGDIAEFLHDLTHPNPAFVDKRGLALAERDPLRFWQGLSLSLAIALFIALAALAAG